MTAHEQLLVELINRARAAPEAEAALYGIGLFDGVPPGMILPGPKPPLAPHQALINAAGLHSQDMLNRDYFSHNSPEGQTPFTRMAAAGYTGAFTSGENISWGGTTGPLDQNAAVYDRHAGLFRSPSHRPFILASGFREVGAGIRFGVFTQAGVNYNAAMVTEDFGGRSGDAFLTGIVFTDAVAADSFYTIGEGLGAVTITAVDANNASFSATSGPSGGYSLQVPPGTYSVRADGPAIGGAIVVSNVVVGTVNRKVDFNSSLRPEIAVDLNGANIPDGLTTPIDFGSVLQGQAGPSRSFNVRNVGTQTLALGAPTVPAGFTVTKAPASTLAPGGSDTFTIQLDSSASGIKTGEIVFATNDGDESPFNFAIAGTVTAPAVPPTISDIADAAIDEDSQSVPIAFSIGSTFPGEPMTLAVTSSNAALIPASNIVLGGGGSGRTLALTPAANQSGTATIKITITDPRGLSASDEFVLTVRPINDEPTILPIADRIFFPNTGGALFVGVSDLETPAAQLVVTATSSNEALIPPGGLVFSAPGTPLSLSISPVAGQEGISTITVRVDDGQASATETFLVGISSKSLPWHNSSRPLDVNGSGGVSIIDVLLVITYLNGGPPFGPGPVPVTAYFDAGDSFGMIDTTGDNVISLLDALLVINTLGAPPSQTTSSAAEAEPVAEPESLANLIDLLATDLAETATSPKRKRG